MMIGEACSSLSLTSQWGKPGKHHFLLQTGVPGRNRKDLYFLELDQFYTPLVSDSLHPPSLS